MPTPVVADAIDRYHDLLATRFDPATWWRGHVDQIWRRWRDIAPMAAYVLRPLMIDAATYSEMQRSLELVMQGFTIATNRLAVDEPLRRSLGIPAYLEPLLDFDRAHGKPACLGRLDAIMTGDGSLTAIEFNSEPQSAPFQYELQQAFARLPITQAFAREFELRSIDLYEEMFTTLAARARGDRMPCIAIIDKGLWSTPRRASVFRPLMYCSARGCPVLYVDPEELDYKQGKLTAGGIEVNLVAFPNWDLLINARKRLTKVLKAVSDGVVEVYAGLSRGLLASYKVVFELLSSPTHYEMFSPEVAAALARHVPWTRVLRERTTDRAGGTVDLLPFVTDHREQLVIKPAGGGGGGNITIGRDVDDATWKAAIQKGVTQNWIVQELAVAERQTFPITDLDGNISFHELNCEFTPYVWNGERIEGVLCRVVAGSVISDLGDQKIGIANGVETATWIINRS